MAVVHEHDDGDGGSSAAVVAIFLIALIVILAILFYGFAVAHWFGFGTTVIQQSAGSGASTAPSAATSASVAASGMRSGTTSPTSLRMANVPTPLHTTTNAAASSCTRSWCQPLP